MCVKFVCALVAQDPDEDSKRTNSKGKFELRNLKKFSNKMMAKDENCSKEFSDTGEGAEGADAEGAAYTDGQDQDKTSLKKTNGKGSTLKKSSTKKMANTQNVESNSQQRSVGKKQRKSSGKQDGTSTPFLGDSALIAELYEESEILPSETEMLLPDTPQDTVDDDSMLKSHDVVGHSTQVKSSWLKNVKVKRTNSGKKETQEINVGDPAWHVQQIVKSKHAASPDDHESVLYNIKVEQQEALMGGWKFDISKGNKFVRIDNNGVKHCSICQNKHSVEVWDLAPAILKVMNRRTLPREGRIDCPHCCGIMPQYRKEAFNMNRDRWKQENDDWKAPIFDPLPGNELEIYQIDELIEQPNSADKPSPYDLGITALAVNSSNMSFCVADMQGKVAELDLANGMITGKYHHSTSSKVHCLCPVGDYMYMGLDDGVQEAILDSDPSKTKLQRKFSGQEGAICCLVASPCLRLLFSGSKDCSTWAWDLKTGRVLTYKPSMDALIPSAIQHIANEAGVSQPRFTFAFKHHREPVSCADTFSGGMVTGSWDGTVCVSFLTGYKDRCDDQVLVPLARQHLADFKKNLKDRKAEKAKLNEEVQSAINKKQQKLLQSSIDQLQEQVADLEKQVKALTQIDKVRAPRLKNLDQCRRFFYDSRVHPGRVLSVAHGTIQSGAHVIFAGYSDSAVRQWDIVTMTPMCVYMNFTTASLSSIASDDKYLLTGYSDGTIKLWPIHQDTATASTPSCTFTQRNFATLLGHSDQISCLKTMDNLLVSASMDKSVRVWDMQACLSAVCGKYESGGEGEDGGDEQEELPNSPGSSPPATSFTKRVRLGRTVRLGDSNKSGALQEADFDPIFFSVCPTPHALALLLEVCKYYDLT
jgi:WD40 repeat protein